MHIEKFRIYLLPHREEDFALNSKFSNKNDLLCAWRDFNKDFCDTYRYHKLKPQISPLFHFDRVNDGRISHILCV